MGRHFLLTFTGSALAAMLAFGAPAAADADDDDDGRSHHGHPLQAQASPAHHALARSALTDAQRSQVEALAAERRTWSSLVRAAGATALAVLAEQVDRGALDRAALARPLDDLTAAVVAFRLRGRFIVAHVHAAETGRPVDMPGPATEAAIRAEAARHASRMVECLEEALPETTAEQRRSLAAELRRRAAG